jgi:hypothetical protein
VSEDPRAEAAKPETVISVGIDNSPETLVRAWMLALRHVRGNAAPGREPTPPEMLSALGTIAAVHAFARAVCSSELPPEVIDAIDRGASANGDVFGKDYAEFMRSEAEAEAAVCTIAAKH